MNRNILTSLLVFCFLSMIQVSAQEVAKARKSEGIYAILRRHGINPTEKSVAAFKELNEKKLRGKEILLVGETYKLPLQAEEPAVNPAKPIKPIKEEDKAKPEAIKPKPEPVKTNPVSPTTNSKKETWSLLGEKYKFLEPKSTNLKGAVFYLVAGHGGADPGAIGSYNGKKIPEDEYAYDVTLRLAKSLKEHGAKVHMIIQDKNDGIRDDKILAMDKDEICYPTMKPVYSRHKSRLRQRTDAINDLYKEENAKYQRVVCVHVDSRAKKDPPIQIDAYCFYYHNSKKGKALSDRVVKIFGKKYKEHQPDRGYTGSARTSNFYVLKYSKPVATYIELGNINHPRDQKRIMHSDNRQALANWLTEVMLEDYKANK